VVQEQTNRGAMPPANEKEGTRMASDRIEAAYAAAKERFAELGVDTDEALRHISQIPISLHCWQGDDIGGFEGAGGDLGGGLAVTGNYPGKATTPDQLRSDLDVAYSLIPGSHRLNLHALYGEFGGKKVDRDEITPEHFQGWIEWAKAGNHGVDFNPSYFAHAKAEDGFTLAHADKGIRDFWIEHGKRCREIGAAFGSALNTPAVTNFWMPDGYKDSPADRTAPRVRMTESLDEIFAAPIDPALNIDAVEPKLFGIGSESYVVGSHEYYLGYAITRNKLLCLDAGHFHPTESIADKISSVMLYVPEILLHVSRGVRWDSDHVVTFTEDLQNIALEIIRTGRVDNIHIGLDFFDAQINRVAAWVIGTRNMIKALLLALLEPANTLKAAELAGDYTTRLVLLEEQKSLPWAAVWDYYCEQKGVPVGDAWLKTIRQYETDVLFKR
jgi:L-rhamnose isomerase